MKTIADMRIHLGRLRNHGLMQVAMVDVEKCLEEIERELEEEYVPLPKDADGVPINIGDEVYENESYHERMSFMWLTEEGWVPCCFDCVCELLHHYKPPTVEDVLREMLVQAVGYSDANTTIALNAITKFAERLRLRKED